MGTGGAVVTSKDGQLVTRIREDRQNLAAVAAVSEGGKALVLLAQNGVLRETAAK